MGLLKPVVEPILDAVYRIEEEQIWRKDLFSNPHGEPWHTSFHSSSFPGDDPKACGRKAIYTLMNIPAREAISRKGRAVMDIGKAIEENIVWRFYRAGILLSDPPDAKHQMGYTDAEHWLTCAPDAIINLPKKNRPHPVEIKSKSHSVVEEMQHGQRSYDRAHRSQLLTQIGLARKYPQWPELDEVIDGTILYVSRDYPHTTHEYRFNYNDDFMAQGSTRLKEWKEHFLNETLPERPTSWKWTEPPCKWCHFKPYCKQDVKDKVEKLPESNTIAHAKEVRGEYDYEATRDKVLNRWKEKEVD